MKSEVFVLLNEVQKTEDGKCFVSREEITYTDLKHAKGGRLRP